MPQLVSLASLQAQAGLVGVLPTHHLVLLEMDLGV